MILYLDVGNSRLKWAVGRLDGDWQASGDWPLDAPIDAEMARSWSKLEPPQRVVASIVAPAPVGEAVRAWCRGAWGREPTVVRPAASAHGVVNGYADPGQLGVDRWVALVAARALAQGAACIVDCGTAVTVDALDGDGHFVAGAILPGLELSRRALLRGTSRVRPHDGGSPDLRARDTAQAVAAGVLVGLGGAVDRLIESMLVIVGGRATTFLTGGDAAVLAPELRHCVQPCPDLVLRGLRVIAGGRA